jgi:hypothetical protein
MMALFYVANWSFATGPINEQLMYGVVAGTLAGLILLFALFTRVFE